MMYAEKLSLSYPSFLKFMLLFFFQRSRSNTFKFSEFVEALSRKDCIALWTHLLDKTRQALDAVEQLSASEESSSTLTLNDHESSSSSSSSSSASSSPSSPNHATELSQALEVLEAIADWARLTLECANYKSNAPPPLFDALLLLHGSCLLSFVFMDHVWDSKLILNNLFINQVISLMRRCVRHSR